MASTLVRRPAPEVASANPALAAPPTDAEKYWYLRGRQLRWLIPVQAISFGLIAFSILNFAVSDTRLLLFIIPMTLYGVCMLVSLVSGSRGRDISLIGHRRKILTWKPEWYPRVDVFLPSAGEPLDILENTYRHVARLDWPVPPRVLVLDDSARVQVRELAEEYGFDYLTRPNRGYLKKAGNLRYGYEHSDGDLIVVLDADFVPRPDFLAELVPYFDDQSVGIVQSPQFFDTRAKSMGWLQRCAGATQELFYRVIQPSRDRVGAAICVGTCAIYRRAALMRSGGFAQIGHSEDVHTGVQMMKVGLRVKYVPVLVSKGLCPDQPGPFLSQQYRWCTGSMALLSNKEFHTNPHITPKQRLCFWAGFLYYISTAVNALVAPLPAIIMLWLLPKWVEPANSVWLLGAISLWFLVLPVVMRGKWRVDVLRLQYLYSFAHLVAISHILFGRTREWVATGTNGGSTRSLAVTIARPVRIYVLASQILIWTGLAHGIATRGIDEFWAMVLLGIVGSFIQLPLLFIKVGPPRSLRERIRSALLPIRTRQVRSVAVASASAASRATATTTATGTTTAPSPAAVIPAQRSAPPPTLDPALDPALDEVQNGMQSETSAGRDTKPEAPGERRWRPDIQGLRAIAVLLVVLYHANVPHITGGYVGVDVFFVISGFLITGQLVREVELTGRVSLSHFWAGRIRRLLPAAVIVVVATVVAARLWDSIFHVSTVARDAIFTLFYSMNYRLAAMGVDYQNADGPVSPLQHMWSLAVEEQFYILWPLIVLVCAFVARRHAKLAIAIAAATVLGVSLYLSAHLTVTQPQYSYFSLHTRAWELGVGALLALVAKPLGRTPRPIAVVMSWAGLAAIVVSGLRYTDDTPFPGTAALLPVLASAVVIAAGCRKVSHSAESLLSVRPLQGIGKVSYGWYLWHWPMVVLIPMAMGGNIGWLFLVEVSLLALWLSVLTHWIIERPTQFSHFPVRRWLAGGLAMSGTAACVATVVILTLPGFVGNGAAAKSVSLGEADKTAVQRALIDGLSVMDSPRNLEPALTEAKGDQPVSSADGCHAGYDQVKQGGYCVYGDPNGAKTLMLIGDSHAQQWLPALDEAGKTATWRVVSWTKAACSLAHVELFNDVLGRNYTECDDWRDQTLKKVVAAKPDLVVVSQSDTVPGTQVSNSEWADKTAESIGQLQQAGIPVVYILDTPFPKESVPDCIARHLSNVGACNVPVKKSKMWSGRMDALQDVLGQRKVTTIDPTDLFCTTQACPAVVGNMLVYRDGSHMTATYSRWLAPMMEPLFTGGSPG